ncbi:MAG: glycosyltransferase family 4 protein [Polymorphobacter sp.]
MALVTTYYPPCNFGGDGRYVRSFAQALARAGCDVEVIYDADAWRAVSGHAEIPPPLPEPDGVTVHALSSRWALGSTLLTQQFGAPVVQNAALKALLARGFDVIHYHNASLIGGPGLWALGDAVKLYTAHEHWLVCANHVLWRYNRELCDARDCFKCSMTFRRPPQLWRSTGKLERAAAHIDEFIALSESVAENHRNFGFTRAMRPMASFLPAAEEAAPHRTVAASPYPRPYFLFVGRLEIIKGLQDVIAAWNGAIPADLLIAGEGNYEPELRALARGKSNIHFLGQVDPAKLPMLYRDARALIACSLCYEVFPMVALEAFRESTPLIARDLGPYAQILGECDGGLLFTNAESLRVAVMTLATDRAERDRLGASGHAAVLSRWSEATAMRDYLALVREVAARRGRSATVARVDALAV